VAGVVTGIICLVVCYGVIVRYLFNRPVGWSEELSTYLMVWAGFLGAACTLQKDGHIGVDVLSRRTAARTQIWLSMGRCAVGTAFCALLAWKGYESCSLSFMLGRVSISELQIPLFIPQMAVPVGAALLALQMLERLIRHAAALVADRGRGS
jgi:TRAP-type C4-dicarboxylate transport system permease small subunit